MKIILSTAIMAAMLLVPSPEVMAEGLFPSKKSKRLPPPPQRSTKDMETFDIVDPKTWAPYSYVYAGITAGAGFGELSDNGFSAEDRTFSWGGFAGYMVRPSPTWAFGVEADYTRNGFKVFNDEEEEHLKSLWSTTARLRVGMYPLKDVPLMPYVTGGAAWADNGKGLGASYGAGIEWEVNRRVAARVEAIRLNFDGFDQDSTLVRAGLSFALTP